MDPAFTQTLELVRSAQGGDKQALERLFTRYYDRLRSIVRVRLGPQLRSRMESGDILQEIFLDAMKGFDRFQMRHESAFLQWLARIAENRIRDAADYHAAQKRDARREVPLVRSTDSGPVGFDPVASGLIPPDALSAEEQRTLVEGCLDDLDPEYRELILQRDYVGSSWDEIAQATGRPSPDAARMKHATAIVELAKLLRSRGGTTGEA